MKIFDPWVWPIIRHLPAQWRDVLNLPLTMLVRWPWVFYRELQRDRCFIRAAGMAYATLIAMVPSLMLVFGVFDAIGLLEREPEALNALLFGTILGGIPEVREVLLPGLLRVDLATMGLASVAMLMVVAMRLFTMVEGAYTDIFGAQRTRPMLVRVLTFYFVTTALPVVLAATLLRSWDMAMGFGVSWVRLFLPPLLQLVLLIVAIKLFPPTKVRWGPAIAGGLVSWMLILLGARGFGLYLTTFASDNPVQLIYGSLAVVPVFLLWLYLLWVFILLGVEVAAVSQHYDSMVEAELEQQRRACRPVQVPDASVALQVAAVIGHHFMLGSGPLSNRELADACGVQERDIVPVARVLEAAEILVHVEKGWLVSRPPSQIAAQDVLLGWREGTGLSDQGPNVLGARIAEELDGVLSGTLEEAIDAWMVHASPAGSG